MARLDEACDVDRFDGDGVISREELAARVAGKLALISMVTDAVDRSVIEAGTSLRVIANAAVGYNNIDVAAARARGIIVTNTPDVLTDATADFTMALILAVTRPKDPQLVENDGPGDDREEQQHQKNDLGHRPERTDEPDKTGLKHHSSSAWSRCSARP